MNTLMIASALLSLAVNSCFGHAIARVERNESNVPPQDVYEVNDKSSALSFKYPHQKEQTLREITYYHVVERPYKHPNAPSAEDPGFDETLRPFTNSHGFQFLDPDLDQESVQEADNEAVPPATTTDPEYEIVYVDEIDDENDEASATTEQQTDAIQNDEEPKETVVREEPEIETVTEVKPVTEKPLDSKVKHTRKLLFDLVKEKYGNSNEQNATSTPLPQKRQKRAINQIPEAPRLGELNLDSLPPYLRKMIAAEHEQKDDNSDEDLKLIEHKVRGLFEELETADDDEEPKTEAPKTYGMNLTGDSGYIWNDMWSDPGIYFNVEDSHTDVTTDAEQESIEESQDSDNEDDDDIEVHITKEDRRRERRARIKGNDDVIDDATLPDDVPIEGRSRKHKNKNENQDDTMKDLIQNEQFWKWLANWTSVNMKAMSEHIKKQIKEEVARQSATTATNTEKETKADSDKPNHEESPKETKDSENDHLDSQDAATDKLEPEIKDGMLLIGGKEIPIVHDLEPNADEIKDENSLKRHKDKDNKRHEDNKNTATDNVNEKHTPVNIKAKNLFGSTIDSENVTNIFIFYANKENNDIIPDLQAFNISEPTIYVIGKPSDIVDVTNAPNKDTEDINDPTEKTTVPAVIELSTESLVDNDNKDSTSTILTTASPNDQQLTTATEETLATEKIVSEDKKLNDASTPEINVRQPIEVNSESTRDEVFEEENSQEEVSNQELDNYNEKGDSPIEKVGTDTTDVTKRNDDETSKE